MKLLESDDDPAEMLAALRALGGDAGIGGVGLPRPRRLPPARRLRHLGAVRARAARRAAPVDPDRGLRARPRGCRRRRPDRRRPEPGPRGAPGGVRRAARRGSAHLPAPRRARDLQRHLGVGADATCRARRRPPPRGQRSHRRARARRRRRPRRDVRDAHRLRRTRRPRSSRRAPSTGRRTPPRTRPRSSGRHPQPPPDPSGLPPGVGRLMRATGIALDSLFGSSEAEHEHDRLRGLAASPGVYEGPARLRRRPVGVRAHRPGRRAADPGDDRGVQHLVAAARGDRHRQRRPALALGDRGARVRHPRRGRDARRRPSASPTARVCASTAPPARSRCSGERGRPARRGERDRRSSGRRRSGSATRSATGSRSRPGIALSGPVVEAVAVRGRAGDRRGRRRRSRDAARAARGALVGRRRGRQGRQLRRPAPHAAQRPVGRRGAVGVAGDLVVGELGLGHHLPPTRRPLHPPERRRGRSSRCSIPTSRA